MSARRSAAVPLGLAVAVALVGCSRAAEPPEAPDCVGEVVAGAERVAVMVPTDLSGGGRAVASEVDMAADPPTADLGVVGPSLDEPLRLDVSVGTTFEAEGTTYEVVRLCASRLDVVPRPE